jgi:hypothetical protein
LKAPYSTSPFRLWPFQVFDRVAFALCPTVLEVCQAGLPAFRQPIAIDSVATGPISVRQTLADEAQQSHRRDRVVNPERVRDVFRLRVSRVGEIGEEGALCQTRDRHITASDEHLLDVV